VSIWERSAEENIGTDYGGCNKMEKTPGRRWSWFFKLNFTWDHGQRNGQVM